MFLNMYAIGKANARLKVGDTQLRCEYGEGVWMIYVLMPGMTKAEARNIQTGNVSVAFAVIEDELFLLGKMGELEWFDAPFEPARFAEMQEYNEFEEEMGASVVVIGADSRTGIVRALRSFAMSNSMSNALHAVCRDMDVRHRPLDVRKQNEHIQKIYRRFPVSDDMLRCVEPTHITVLA